MMIREIKESDAEGFLHLLKKLDEETEFMMFEPGERSTKIEEQRNEIKGILLRNNETILVAEKNGHLIGYIGAYGGRYIRNRHTAHIVIGILQDFAGQRIGTKLFTELERWAYKHKVHRLELRVMVHNERAIGLYEKMGFEIEGMKRHSLFINGSYVDEYYMAKLLQ